MRLPRATPDSRSYRHHSGLLSVEQILVTPAAADVATVPRLCEQMCANLPPGPAYDDCIRNCRLGGSATYAKAT